MEGVNRFWQRVTFYAELSYVCEQVMPSSQRSRWILGSGEYGVIG